MRTQDLEYFIALAKHMHFQKAAEECRVSQPALSVQIKKLEDELGVALLVRKGKFFSITPAGSRIILQANKIIKEVNALKKLASELRCDGEL